MDFHECVNDTDTGPDEVAKFAGALAHKHLVGSTPAGHVRADIPAPKTCDQCSHRYDGEYSTHVYTKHVQGLLTDWTPAQKPIFLYMAWQVTNISIGAVVCLGSDTPERASGGARTTVSARQIPCGVQQHLGPQPPDLRRHVNCS